MDNDSSATGLNVCRICLASDCKIYSMRMYCKLRQAYENLTGILLDEDNLPQNLCFECSQRLLNSSSFRRKCIQTNLLLDQLARIHAHLTLYSIKSINRESHHLNSTLSQTVIETGDNLQYDKQPEDDNGPAINEINKYIKVEFKVEDETPLEESQDFKIDIDYNDESIRQIESCIQNTDDCLTHARNSDTVKTEQEQLELLSGNSARRLPHQQVPSHDDAYESITVFGNPYKKTTTTQEQQSCVNKEKNNKKSVARRLTKEISTYRRPIRKPDAVITDNKKRHKYTNKFSCHLCGNNFVTRHSLIRHLKSHDGAKPYSCEVCEKRFTQKHHLRTHVIIHTGENPFCCDVCGKKFTAKGSLNVHLRIHADEKPFSCDVCEKKFTQKTNLRTHLMFHAGKRPFSCDVYGCEKKFTTKGYLNEHLKTHGGDKPYCCEVCGKKFTCKGSLNKHLRIHAGENSHSCDVCGKKFTRKDSLNKHLKCHAGEKPFSCNVCGKKYTEKHNLRKHSVIHSR